MMTSDPIETIAKKCKEYGKVDVRNDPEDVHITVTLNKGYNYGYQVSIMHNQYSYGYEDGLLEAAIVCKRGVFAVTGRLDTLKAINYVRIIDQAQRVFKRKLELKLPFETDWVDIVNLKDEIYGGCY